MSDEEKRPYVEHSKRLFDAWRKVKTQIKSQPKSQARRQKPFKRYMRQNSDDSERFSSQLSMRETLQAYSKFMFKECKQGNVATIEQAVNKFFKQTAEQRKNWFRRSEPREVTEMAVKKPSIASLKGEVKLDTSPIARKKAKRIPDSCEIVVLDSDLSNTEAQSNLAKIPPRLMVSQDVY